MVTSLAQAHAAVRLPASAPAPLPMPRFRAVRGAITVDADDPALIEAAVRELLVELTTLNALTPDAVVSALFSATPDLRSRPPAAAARAMGWDHVPMLCIAEMDVDGSLPRCIRVLLHVSVDDGRRMRPVYLRAARSLRPDLVGDA
ncbi:MAG: chorismate mutase [Gemmatirosa sp.]|nr:chorismate mutase [Gemmatirosa sp.]